jgi:deoxyribose-phosphate aldolase
MVNADFVKDATGKVFRGKALQIILTMIHCVKSKRFQER